MLAATSSTINVKASTPSNGENRRAGNRRTTTTTAQFVPSATQGQTAEPSRGRESFRARNTGIRGNSRGRGWGDFSGGTARGSSTLGSEVFRSGGEEAVIGGQAQLQQRGQSQPQRGRGSGRSRGSGTEQGRGTSRGRGTGSIGASRGRGRSTAELGRVLGQILAPAVRGRGSTPSTPELGRNLGQSLGRGRAAAQVQLPETQIPHLPSHSQQAFPRPAGSESHLQQPASRNPQFQQYQPRRIPTPGNTNANTITTKGPLIARPRSALGAYTEGERTQLENGVGVWRSGRPPAQIRQFEGRLWVQNENWVDGGDNNNEVTLVPVVDLTNMADGIVNVFGGGRGGRGRGGNGEGGSGRGRGGAEGASNRGRGGGDNGGVRGRGRGRGRGGADGGSARGTARGARGGRGRGGSGTGSGAETNGYGSGYESGGGGGPGSLFITDGNDDDMDSEMESERENGNRVSKDDRAVRFSEGTTGHQKMTKLKATRERERADLIRRGIIDDPNNRKPLSEALTFVGTCIDMCPMFEREERQFQKSVDKLEIDSATGLIDPRKAVKAFHRPAAGNESALPSDVRPPKVLVWTLDYLVGDIVGGNLDLMSTHGFVRDRTRGIRQDFTLQNYRGLETIDCHERIARYHILCIHQLAQDDRFVLQQEMEQLQKCMTTLNELYDDAKKDGISCPNEPELRAYQIIVYIHDTECQRAAQKWGFADTEPGVQQALRLHQAAFKNAPRFFNLLRRRETTYLMGCIAEAHFYHIRKEHFRKMRQAYNKDTTSVTLADVERQLAFDHKSDLDRYLEHFGIETALDGQGEEYIVPNRNFDDSRPQLRPTCNQRIVEVKREGRKIPDVINGVTRSITKGKARAGPFEEDFSAEADLGPRKIQSWVPDEEETSGSHEQPWEDSQAYADPIAAYQQSQGFQQGRIPFQQQNKGNVFQQKQSGAPNGFSLQNALAGQNKSPFAPSAFQQKTPAFARVQQGGPQQPPSAFQQAMSSFPTPPVPAFPQPSSNASVFNPAAPAFKPSVPAFQQVAPAFAKPTTGPFSQTAPAFSGGTNASAVSLGSGFSAKFGQSSASASQSTAPQSPAPQSTAPHKPPADSHLVNKAPSPTPAFTPPKQQLHTPNQGFVYYGSGDQSGTAWQQEGGWDQEGYYQGEGGEEGYYEEHAGGDGDEDDEYALRQADIVRRQGEVAQMKAQVDAQLEETKRMLAEKEAAAQQRKKDKKQAECLLNHNFAQQGIQQQQKSIFDLPPQQPPTATPLFSFSKPAEEPSPPNVGAFGPPKGASSVFFQNFKIPQSPLSPGLENRISFDREKAAGAGQRSNAPGPEPNIISAPEPKPERELSPEPSPPHQDPAVLLEQFSLYVNARMRDVVQAASPMARKRVLDELRVDLQDALDTQPGLEECCNILATAFYRGNISYAAFTFWKKRTAAKVRKARMAVLRAEKRRLLAEREKGLGTIEEQWVPVKIKIRPGDNLVRQGDLFRDFNFHELPLDDIFANPIQKASMSRGIVRTNFSLICVNAEPKAEYWWLRKFGISSGVGIGVLPRKKKLANENTFTVERVLREPEPPTDVGALIFGCRADWSMSNVERFEADKRDLHAVMEYALRNCRYEKIAIMVICYRSPLDKRDADPYGEEVDRTEGEGRKNRLKAIRRALGLNTLPKERVITKEIVLLETLQDMNMISAVKRFAKSAAGVVGGEGLGKKEVKKIIPSVESVMELVPYEEVVTDMEEGLQNGQYRRPAKRKISISSPVGGSHNANILAIGVSNAKRRTSISPPRLNGTLSNTRKSPATNGIILTKQQTPSTPGSEYFKLKSHGIYVSPLPITNTTTVPSISTPIPNPFSNHHESTTSSSFGSPPHRGYPLPLLPRSSTSAAAFKQIVIKSTFSNSHSQQPQASRKRTRASNSHPDYQLDDYQPSSPPKRRASEEREERERREMEEHDKKTSAIRAALYDFENDPVVVEARRIREAPEYHPELEWPELVMGGV